MTLETFFEKFDQFADAPGAVAKMRELVLELAVQGKLVEQRPKELSAKECIRKANKPLVEVALDDSIETPAGWLALPLGCLIAANTGGGTPSKQNPSYWNGPIPWASVKDVQSDKYLVATIDSITDEGLKDSSSNLIPPNRLIVVTRMGLGKLAINTIPVAINQDLRAIEPTTALDLDFAYLLFKSLKMVGSGVTVKGITVDKLHAMHVLLPPLAEQKRIVAKVDELMALCDRLEAQQQERETWHAALTRASLARFADAPTPANLSYLFHSSFTIPPSDLRKSILTLAVQGKLVPQDPNDEPASQQFEAIRARRAELVRKQVIKKSDPSRPVDPDEIDHDIPVSWAWVRLVEICELITDGTHLTPKYTEAGRMFLSAQNVKPFKFMPAKHRFVSEEDYQGYVKNRKPERGDVLLTRVGAGIGEAATIDQDLDFAIYVSLGLVRPVRGFVFSDYITLWLNSPDGTEKSSRNTYGKGVSQGNLNLSLIRNFLVPLPPLAEQRRIVDKVEQLMALVDALETQLAASRATAAKLLSALVTEISTK